MSSQVYALLVGINDYPSHVGNLDGCLNDTQYFHDYLLQNFDRDKVHIETLIDADATRPNIIDQFRNHLSGAGKDDIVLFKYSGHGARWKSAGAFKEFYPDGKDEGLVCFDSRRPGGFDLADKEMAVLLAELARNDPHIAIILDCCHSGSATRSADSFTQRKKRRTHERDDERPLETYLDGYYAELQQRGDSLDIPASKHILLAACQRVQEAWEAPNHSGLFSTVLLDALDKSGTDVSYADLFVRCRTIVREQADDQDPQFETYRGFNAYSGFLGGKGSGSSHRYHVYFNDDSWQVECGAIHGLPSDPEKTTELALYPESDATETADEQCVGHAETVQVGAQISELDLLDIDADPSERFQGQITSLPVPPLPIFLDGDADGAAAFEEFFNAANDESIGISLITDSEEAAKYVLSAEDDCFLLKLRETGKLIQGAKTYEKAAADYMFTILRRVAAWERAVVLQNHWTKMKVGDVGFKFVELVSDEDEDEEAYEYDSDDITIDIQQLDGEWQHITATLKANNRSKQPLHLMLVHFSEDYEVAPLYNERVEPTNDDFTVTLDGNSKFGLGLSEDEGDQAIHTFKLIVSTEKVDDFLLQQEPMEIGKVVTPRVTRGLRLGPTRKKYKNEWFTKDLHIRLVRKLDTLTEDDTKLAGGKITIKGHPSLKGGASLGAAKTVTRGVGTGSDIYRVLERQGMELMNFSSTRGNNDSILELTDIQNSAALKDEPLEIELDIDLSEHEFILPVAFDGTHMLLVGDPSRDDAGRTRISISEIPEIPDNRRSVGKALKLYFFKTFLKHENVNRLCWVEYKEDGTLERHRSGVAEKVAAAKNKNILLLVHGIIGDTQNLAEGLALATDSDGVALHKQFDVVLTYDYENLSTPIAETAAQLQEQLEKEAGLHEGDDLRLTVLVHSMGGLVARWFIEQEGGNKVVDHLVMFGTPNIGSPFGKVETARHLSILMTTLAMNTFPAIAPFGGALLYLLNRSGKLTPTLEQMEPGSDFIKKLNDSDDPGVPYTIVAGDTRDFKEESDKLIPDLISKIGGGILFDALYQGDGHDIAVSDESIRGVSALRSPAPKQIGAICHHLNYFMSEAGLKAMADVKW